MERFTRAWSPGFVHRNLWHLLIVVGAFCVASCGGQAVPTSPGDVTSGEVLALELSCTGSLLIGQRAPCVALARLRSGQTPVVNPDARWSSSRPEVVAVDALGVVNGRSAGQAVVSASYHGREAAATGLVVAEDGLRINSGQAHQGDFTPGSTVTMWLQGYYSVASADTGRLSLRITDQAGIVATTAPVAVAKGGDFFLLSSTFVVPESSIEVCRTTILEVGSVTIAEPNSKAFAQWCIPVRR